MQRSKSVVIYAATQNLAACQYLLGHKSIGSTVPYVGMDEEMALELAKKIQI
ncbi:MAG TPA: hypothetical protein PKD12_03700 [Nitrospira sp.]|nr:hypothetical protein [Nitrospira sp.]